MPLHDKAGEVAGAVASALAQRAGDFELIVVDDGSTDGGAEVVRAAGDPRVRVLRQENAGAAAARNRGVAAARAGTVAFLDADDAWDPGFLGTVRELARRFPECSVFATSYRIASADGRVRPAVLRGVPGGEERLVLRDYFRVAAASDPPLWTSAVAVRREALLAVGGFPAGIPSGEDLLTWARLAARFPVAYCRAPLATFREPASVAARRGRAPLADDPVGDALADLARGAGPAERGGLQAYRALWHRMRASRCLQAGDARGARGEALRSLRLRPAAATLGVGALALLPGGAGRALHGRLRAAVHRARSTGGGP